MTAKLSEINVHGVNYQYIDYGDDNEVSTSVDGLIIPVDSDVRDKLLNVGGFYRDLLTPLSEDETIKRIVVLSVTERGMSQLVGFFFDNGEKDMKVSWTKEPKIVKHYENHIKEKDVTYENINTLEFLQSLSGDKTQKYFKILDRYYNPISVDDTGLHVNGKVVKYGQTIIINNFKKMIDKHSNLKGSNLDTLSVDKIELNIYDGGPRFMETIGSGKLYNKEGKLITRIEDYYYSYVNKKERDYEKFLNEYRLDLLHDFALRANERIKVYPEQKEEIVNGYMSQYEKELEEDNEPATQMIGLNLLLSCIEENLVEIVDESKSCEQ